MTANKKLTLATIKAKCAELGAEYSCDTVGNWTTVNVDAPDGRVWCCTGDITMLVATWLADDKAYKAEALTDLLERMEMGHCEGYPEGESDDA